MIVKVLTLVFCIIAKVNSQVSFSVGSATYLENFDSLLNNGTANTWTQGTTLGNLIALHHQFKIYSKLDCVSEKCSCDYLQSRQRE